MINLLKYEIKNRKVPVLWVVAGIFIVNLLIALRFIYLIPKIERFIAEFYKNKATDIFNYISHYDPLFLGVAIFSSGVIFILPILNGFTSFTKDYFKNSKYLVCSIPKRATSIIGAKLIVSICEATLVAVSFVFWFTSFSFIILRGSFRAYLNLFLEYAIKNVVPVFAGFVAYLFQLVLFLLMVYFIMLIFKFVRIKKAFAIIIAIITVNLFGFIQNFFIEFFSRMTFLDIKINMFHVEHITKSLSIEPFTINIGVIAFLITFASSLFFAITYLIENKMEI